MKEWNMAVNWKAAALGCAVAVVAMITLTAVGAGLMARGMMGVEWMNLWAAGVVTVSGLLSGLTGLLGGGTAADAALAAAGELVVLLGLNGVLCGGRMEGLPATALALAGGCGAAVLLRLGKRNGRRRRRRR